MTQLIPFEKRIVGQDRIETVDGRELHAFLGIAKDYNAWMRQQIKRARLKEERDFTTYQEVGSSRGGRPQIDYYLTFDASKHVGMLSGSEKGYQVREYFIACENELHEQPATRGDLLVQMAEAYRLQEQKLLAIEAEQRRYEHELLALQQQTIATQQETIQAKDIALTALHGQSWVTIRQYLYLHQKDYAHIMTDAAQKAFARHLGKVCFENGVPMYKALTADTVWPDERTYPLAMIETTLASWLGRQTAQIRLVEEA